MSPRRIVSIGLVAIALPTGQALAQSMDSVFTVQDYGSSINAQTPANPMRPLPSLRGQNPLSPVAPTPACTRGDTIVSNGQCIPVAGTWGPGQYLRVHSDNCGGTFNTLEACDVPCNPVPRMSAQSSCQPSSGSAGPGLITQTWNDWCGAPNYTRQQSCCLPGDQVIATSECVANSGTYGDGTYHKTHDNYCGSQWEESLACYIDPPPPPPPPPPEPEPQPPTPQPPTPEPQPPTPEPQPPTPEPQPPTPEPPVVPNRGFEEILVCNDYDLTSVRPMPYDFYPYADPATVWRESPYTANFQNRWNFRMACLYHWPGLPENRFAIASPWLCAEAGHPDPANGYCFKENPRYAEFYRMNQGAWDYFNTVLRPYYTRPAITGNGVWGDGNPSQFYDLSPDQQEVYRSWGRRDDARTEEYAHSGPQKAY